MKRLTLLLALITISASAQNIKKIGLNLTNAIVIAQTDKMEDRYSLEINTTELLNSYNIKAVPSLNIMKLGQSPLVLISDSIVKLINQSGIDTYLLLSVRGFDRRFKVSGVKDDLETALGLSGLFGLFREDIVSISFEVKFFRASRLIYSEIIKCGNIGDRESVIKRFRKKLRKRITKKWGSKF